MNNNIFDISKERDFISYKINKKNNKKSISKSITTTIKYQFKTTNNSSKKYRTKLNETRNEKNSTILRSQSNILNNRPTDSFILKNNNILNGDINNYKSKQNNTKIKENNISSSYKGFENFNLNKVCGSSHPLKETTNKNNKENHINKKNGKNSNDNNNNEYKCIKSYTIKYDYKEEDIIDIDNNKIKNYKLLYNSNKINNNGNSLNKNNYEILLLSEKAKFDTKDKKKQNRNK
jgi:hypothetical protein